MNLGKSHNIGSYLYDYLSPNLPSSCRLPSRLTLRSASGAGSAHSYIKLGRISLFGDTWASYNNAWSKLDAVKNAAVQAELGTMFREDVDLANGSFAPELIRPLLLLLFQNPSMNITFRRHLHTTRMHHYCFKCSPYLERMQSSRVHRC